MTREKVKFFGNREVLPFKPAVVVAKLSEIDNN